MSELAFYFDFASTYSHVAALRVASECARRGVRLVYKPFLLGPIFEALLHLRDSPFNAQPVRGAYMWRDLERLCAKHSLPWRKPSVFPRKSVLAAKAACAGEGAPWLPAFIEGVFRRNFAEDLDIADPAVLTDALTAASAPAQDVLERCSHPDVRTRLRANTARAQALGIFGAPNFVIGDHPGASRPVFFGQDRLEDALEWAVAHASP